MKKFKKASILLLILLMTMMSFAACGGAEEPATEEPATEEPAAEEPASEAAYVDGTYYAEMADFDENGWKDNATVTITDGKIASVVLNATNKDAAAGDKLAAVAAGKYDMTVAGAKAPWDQQAKAIQDYIVTNQGTETLTFNAEGKSDAISGATISYGHFIDLVNEALAQAKAE